MSELLSDVLKIEENAKRLTEEAKKKKEQLARDINKSSQKLHDELLERASVKLEKVRADETASANVLLLSVEENKKKQMEKIKAYENENFDRLVKEITNAIIG
jgi:PBP1b-binding outer membrane lipoprotein LpoB